MNGVLFQNRLTFFGLVLIQIYHIFLDVGIKYGKIPFAFSLPISHILLPHVFPTTSCGFPFVSNIFDRIVFKVNCLKSFKLRRPMKSFFVVGPYRLSDHFF